MREKGGKCWCLFRVNGVDAAIAREVERREREREWGGPRAGRDAGPTVAAATYLQQNRLVFQELIALARPRKRPADTPLDAECSATDETPGGAAGALHPDSTAGSLHPDSTAGALADADDPSTPPLAVDPADPAALSPASSLSQALRRSRRRLD